MKLTKETLKRIIREELENVVYTSDAAMQLGMFEDAADDAMKKLESISIPIDDFEEQAIEAHKNQPGEDTVYFIFNSQRDMGQVEPVAVEFEVTLLKNGESEVSEK